MIQWDKKGGGLMEQDTITVQSVMDEACFTEFALFDVMRRQKRWQRPALFAVFFTALSLLAFSRRGQAEQAALLGWILLIVGLALPLVYLVSFFLSVRQQARKLRGAGPAYTLSLDGKGLTVRKGEQTLSVPWEKLHAVYRLKHSICLYTDARHAFLLPRSCGEEVFAAAWRLLEGHTEPAKRRDLRP